MITKLNGLMREEKGAALVLTLVLLLIGGLVIAPVLGHMGTGIKAGEVHDEKMGEVYAADAGVEHALWNMITELEVPELSKCALGDFNPDPYTFEMDGRTVRVKMEFVTSQDNRGIFKVTSEVFSVDDESLENPLTTIVSHVEALYVSDEPLDFSGLLDYAISSDGTITIQPNSEVQGDIYIHDSENLDDKGDHIGEVKDSSQVDITWPTAEQLSAYYFADVEDLAPFANGVIDIADVPVIEDTKKVGPIYREGNLEIKNTGSVATLTLDGTIYVKGNLDFAQPEGKNGAYTINLNGQTIYVEGDVYFPPKFVSLAGSGCIIATGQVWFQPGMNSSEGEFVFVMSTDNRVWFNPSGNFYGAIAGEAEVQLQPGNNLTWVEWRDKPLNFPIGEDEDGGTTDEGSWQSWDVTIYNINPGSD